MLHPKAAMEQTSNPVVRAASEIGPAPRAWRRWLLLAVVLAMISLVVWGSWHRLLTLESIVAIRDQFQAVIASHPAIAVLAYVAGYAGIVALSFPSAGLLTAAGGLFFGGLTGGAAAVVAATLGATILFSLTRFAAGENAAAHLGPQIIKLQHGFKQHAFAYLVFCRLVPIFPFCIVNIVPAVLGIPLRTFFWGTLLGIIPATFALASVGSGLDGVIMTAKAEQVACMAVQPAASCPLMIHAGSLVTPQLQIAFAVLSLLALLPVAAKQWRKRNGS